MSEMKVVRKNITLNVDRILENRSEISKIIKAMRKKKIIASDIDDATAILIQKTFLKEKIESIEKDCLKFEINTEKNTIIATETIYDKILAEYTMEEIERLVALFNELCNDCYNTEG